MMIGLICSLCNHHYHGPSLCRLDSETAQSKNIPLDPHLGRRSRLHHRPKRSPGKDTHIVPRPDPPFFFPVVDPRRNREERIRPRRCRPFLFDLLREPLSRTTGKDYRTRMGTPQSLYRVCYRRDLRSEESRTPRCVVIFDGDELVYPTWLDGLRKEPPTASEMTEEHDAGAKRKLPSDTDKGHENERGDGRLGTLARETVRDEQDTNATSDHGNDRNGTFAPQDDQRDEPWEEEEVSAIIPPQRSRIRRRVASEDEEESEREHQEESPAGHDDRDLSQSAEHLHRLSESHQNSVGLLPHTLACANTGSGKSIKQEKHESGNDIQRPQPRTSTCDHRTELQCQLNGWLTRPYPSAYGTRVRHPNSNSSPSRVG